MTPRDELDFAMHSCWSTKANAIECPYSVNTMLEKYTRYLGVRVDALDCGHFAFGSPAKHCVFELVLVTVTQGVVAIQFRHQISLQR